jgi:hypothetical protein
LNVLEFIGAVEVRGFLLLRLRGRRLRFEGIKEEELEEEIEEAVPEDAGRGVGERFCRFRAGSCFLTSCETSSRMEGLGFCKTACFFS